MVGWQESVPAWISSIWFRYKMWRNVGFVLKIAKSGLFFDLKLTESNNNIYFFSWFSAHELICDCKYVPNTHLPGGLFSPSENWKKLSSLPILFPFPVGLNMSNTQNIIFFIRHWLNDSPENCDSTYLLMWCQPSLQHNILIKILLS